jgi:Uncharacterised nucleotidyltransferase
VKPEDQMLFACTRQDFEGKHQQTALELSQQYRLDWDQVFAKAEQHGVAGLVYINLCQRSDHDLGIPSAIVQRYRLHALRNTVRKEQNIQRLQHALEYLAGKSIQAMLIKGVALDILVYDHATYSTLNDIDLVLNIRRETLSAIDLNELMHQLHGGLEYDFYEHHDVTINGALPVDFQQIWRDASPYEYRGHQVWLMCPEDMFISLCINSCRKRFFRLKSLLDIAETTRKMTDMQWEKVLEKTQCYDCANIIYTALLITNQSLGYNLPEGFLENFPINPTRKTVINGMVKCAMRYGSLPAAPISGKMFFGKQVHISLLLPYAAYRPYQVRHKLMNEIFFKARASEPV